MKRIIVSILFLVAVVNSSCQAEFVRIGSANPPGIWLTRGVNGWHVSNYGSWRNLDEQFMQTGVVPVETGYVRGLDYDPVNNRMVLMLHDEESISFHQLDGSKIFSIPNASHGNDVSVDSRDGSVWEAIFGGVVRHYRSDGILLSSFETGFWLSGIAIDSIGDKLLLLRADGPGGADGPLDDELYEFSTSGVNLGRLFDSSLILGNGTDLEYISETGTLYVCAASIGDKVTILSDPSRVPEPACFVLVASAVLALLQRRIRML